MSKSLRARLEELVMHPSLLTPNQGEPVTPQVGRHRLVRFIEVARAILDGLQGNPFRWDDGTAGAWRPIAAQMGFTLVTQTRINKLARRLKRRAKPVGELYFPSPISSYADVYVLEFQTEEVKHEDPSDR